MDEIDQLASEYGIPEEIKRFLRDGFLELLRFDPSDNSVEFHIPSKILTYADGSVLSYSLVWYAPVGVPPSGGSGPAEAGTPTFELRAENSDHGPDWIDCETADDLECWLADLRDADHY